jgi:O-antigen ligase
VNCPNPLEISLFLKILTFSPPVYKYFAKASGFICNSFSWIGLLLGLIACLGVLANDIYYVQAGYQTLTSLLFICAFGLALIRPLFGLQCLIIFLPLVGGLHQQLLGFFGVYVQPMPNSGLDLVAGFFLGLLLRRLICWVRSSNRGSGLQLSMPWPIALALLVITLSTILAIIRNLRLSATATSFKGVLFNLMHFRPMGWHFDFMPVGDWVAYSLSAILVVVTLNVLQGQKNLNQIIFKPLLIGLALSSLLGVIQSATGIGLAATSLDFRKDALGYAAIGFQPDLHSFAGHMLLGAVGLWGYWNFMRPVGRQWGLFIVVGLGWVGLILSKSRASFALALIAICIGGLCYLWKINRRRFGLVVALLVATLSSLILAALVIPATIDKLPVLHFVTDFIHEMQGRDLTNLRDLSGLFGSRVEIFTAAINMIKAYPLMGVGQGNFYHLSSDVMFSKSFFLAKNGGENAHNYFLQTFAETGLVGVIALLLAIFSPFFWNTKKGLLIPGAIGLGALCLGNLFAHSFLVRENLLLGAVLLGLLYACALSSMGNSQSAANHVESASLKSIAPLKSNKLMPTFLALVVIGLSLISLMEIRASFYRYPFEIGLRCFKNEPLTDDRWSAGVYEISLPSGARGIEIPVDITRPNLKKEPVILRLDLIQESVGSLSTVTNTWDFSGKKVLRLTLPDGVDYGAGAIKARLRFSSCYTPRDLGVNTDGRRLGGQIGRVVFF